jgi:hypothetical protein
MTWFWWWRKGRDGVGRDREERLGGVRKQCIHKSDVVAMRYRRSAWALRYLHRVSRCDARVGGLDALRGRSRRCPSLEADLLIYMIAEALGSVMSSRLNYQDNTDVQNIQENIVELQDAPPVFNRKPLP